MPGVTLYLTEDDVRRLLSMEACIDAVEQLFLQWADGRAANRPRSRAAVAGAILHVLPAASEPLGRMAAKVYATTKGGARFVVLLFDGRSADLLAILEADRLGQMRTGAASGVATRLLARRDARVLCVLGTGWQARSQVTAVASVRGLSSIRAFGRDPDRLRSFCREVEAASGIGTIASASAEQAVRGADIVVTATNSARPVLMGGWIEPGMHVNAVGSNRVERRELDEQAVRRADRIVVDSIEQARIEAGDFVVPPCDAPHQAPLDRAVELSAILSGRHPGRTSPSEVTLFKSLGLGLEDLAAASLVYDLALKTGTGRALGADPG
jgi:alanine dehydrogenase